MATANASASAIGSTNHRNGNGERGADDTMSVPAADLNDYDSSLEEADENDVEVKKFLETFEAGQVEEDRTYQIALLEMAKRRNLIICLPTGSGKTYIALQLAKYYLPKAIEEAKTIIFLATTVPLVHQQAIYFRDHIFNTINGGDTGIRPLTGEMNVDSWSRSKWISEVQKHLILVMTPQILVDMLNHGYIYFKGICLLILDECHHAGKEHPMSKVMDCYRRYAIEAAGDKEAEAKLTRVLGLTATIIRGVGSVDKIEKEVTDVETIMNAKAITYHDYEEVLKHSTNANSEFIVYDSTLSEPERSQISFLLQPLRSTQMHLMAHPSPIRTQVPENVPASQVFSKKQSPTQKLIRGLVDVTEVLSELGVYCARMAACLKIALLMAKLGSDPLEKCQTLYTTTHLQLFIRRIERVQGTVAKFYQLMNMKSPKLTALVNLLMEFAPSAVDPNAGEDLCAIVFVEKRLTAQILAWYFQSLAKYGTKKHKFLKADFVIGTSNNPADLKEARVSAERQTRVVKKFHQKEINLIFATSVLEEGLDVPMCNLVVRFDTITSYPSYVQSMGRARKRNARFCVLASTTEKRQFEIKCNSFKRYNCALSDHLRMHALHLDDDEDLSATSPDEGILPPFCPGGTPDSPVITMSSAISLVHEYCSILSGDRFSSNKPVCWWSEVQQPVGPSMIKAFIKLPSNAVVKSVIEGPPMPSKYLAKRAVHLMACKELYDNDGLNQNLLPNKTPLPKAVVDFLRDAEKGNVKESTKKFPWYEKKTPAFMQTQIKSNQLVDIFVINIRPQDPSMLLPDSIYNFDSKRHRYGLVLPQGVGTFGGFELEGKFGIAEVTFQKISIKELETGLTKEQMAKFKLFYAILFEKVLSIKLKCAYMTDESKMLVIPLQKGPDGSTYDIAWDVMTQAALIDESKFSTQITSAELELLKEDENFEDGILVPWYRLFEEHILHMVMVIDKDRTIMSKMDENPTYACYRDYYLDKYKLTPKFTAQPLAKCSSVGKQLNFLSTKHEINPRLKRRRKAYEEKIVWLVPEYCRSYPYPSSLYVQARFIPSIIHRICRLLLAEKLKLEIATQFSWTSAIKSDYGVNHFTPKLVEGEVMIYGARSNGNGELPKEWGSGLKANKISFDEDFPNSHTFLHCTHPDYVTRADIERIRACKAAEKEVKPVGADVNGDNHFTNSTPQITYLEDVNAIQATVKDLDKSTDFSVNGGPSSFVIMEALTLAKANDSISLERLELIGDSFLKYVVSIQLFCEFPNTDEGVLTQLRSQIISNKNLCKLGRAKGIPELLSGGIFNPLYTWLPPGYTVPAGLCKVASDLDCTLIGLSDDFTVEELKAMSEDKMVTELKSRQHLHDGSPSNTTYEYTRFGNKSIADAVEALIGAYFTKSGRDGALRCMEYFGLQLPTAEGPTTFGSWSVPKPIRNEDELKLKSVSHFLPFLKDLEELIGYKFSDPWLVVEAFTHSSYCSNSITGSYERLEFLGDAVLDFLVTTHIYEMPRPGGLPPLTPGELTDLRSALVNNITFGSLAVRYGLQKYLLATSSELESCIGTFVEYQEDRDYKVTGHFSLLNDVDSLTASHVEVPKILGDLFESLAGAVYLDCNMQLDVTWKVFYRLLKHEIDEFAVNVPRSPVRELYETYPLGIKMTSLTEEMRKKIPNYAGSVVKIKIGSQSYFGVGSNKANARIAAAKLALSRANRRRNS